MSAQGSVSLKDFSLSIPLELKRFCGVCQEEQIFIARAELANGLLGTCTKCGDERVIPYTRTNSDPEWESIT